MMITQRTTTNVLDTCNNATTHKTKISALSFFSGAMGLDLGLERAGIEVILASEIDSTTQKTIRLNRPDISLISDFTRYSSATIKEFAGLATSDDIDVIVGGPPCQAFSTAGKRRGLDDPRGNVFIDFIYKILELRPRVAVIENVKGLLSIPRTPGGDRGSALSYIVSLLEQGGYSVSYNLYNSANYGSPQKRERVFIICQRGKGRSFLTVPQTHSQHGGLGLSKWKTFREACFGLEVDVGHEFLLFPEKRLKFYQMLKSGQYWKHLPVEVQKEAMGASFFAGGGKTGFYRRLDWDKPSPTLVTDPTLPATSLCHPELDRPLSIQEYMRIQEFPDDWRFCGTTKDKYRQIGNAVPCSLGTAIGKHIVSMLNSSTTY